MADLLPLVDEVKAGDRRRSLEALRDTLAKTITDAEPSNVAALAKQLRDTMTELAELPDATEVDAVDELAQRRGPAEVPKRASRAGKRRAAGD